LVQYARAANRQTVSAASCAGQPGSATAGNEWAELGKGQKIPFQHGQYQPYCEVSATALASVRLPGAKIVCHRRSTSVTRPSKLWIRVYVIPATASSNTVATKRWAAATSVGPNTPSMIDW